MRKPGLIIALNWKDDKGGFSAELKVEGNIIDLSIAEVWHLVLCQCHAGKLQLCSYSLSVNFYSARSHAGSAFAGLCSGAVPLHLVE